MKAFSLLAALPAAIFLASAADAATVSPATFTTTVSTFVQGPNSDPETDIVGGSTTGAIDTTQDAGANTTIAGDFGSAYAVGRATTSVLGTAGVPETFANVQAEAGVSASDGVLQTVSRVTAEASIFYFFGLTVVEPDMLEAGVQYLVPIVMTGFWGVEASAEGRQSRAVALADVTGPGGRAGSSAIADQDAPLALGGDSFRFEGSSIPCSTLGCFGTPRIEIVTRLDIQASRRDTGVVSATATVDPIVFIDPDYEYTSAFAVQLSENIVASVGPGDGPPEVIPLPAPAVLLFAALGSLTLLRRRG